MGNVRGSGAKNRGREGGNFSGIQQQNVRGSGVKYTPKIKQEVSGTNEDTTKADNKTERPAKKSRSASDVSGVKQVMGYPIARGPGDDTGDALVIKCIEYVPPKTGLEASTSRAYAGADGSFEGRNYKKGDVLGKYDLSLIHI